MLMVRGRIQGRMRKKKKKLPVNTSPPVVSGTAAVGSVLTVTIPGVWLNSPSSIAYQWKKNGAVIAGATGINYLQLFQDAGAMITCDEIAIKGAVSVSATSNAKGPVVGIGGAGLLAQETDGFATDFTWPVNAERVAVKTAGSVVKSTVNGFYSNTGASPKMVYDIAGNRVWSPHNMLAQSEAFRQLTGLKVIIR
jgi:hypothetical protein